MRRSFLLVGLVLAFCQMSFTQVEFSPDGAEWCYHFKNLATDEIEAYLGVKYERDTFLRGIKLKILSTKITNVSSEESLERFNNEFLFTQSADSVFYYFGDLSPTFYLFKTQYQEGDTTSSYLFNAPFEITGIDNTTLSNYNIPIAEWELIENPTFKAKILGHLGPDKGFIEGWWTNVLDEKQFDLAAYKDDQLGELFFKVEGCFGLLEYEAPPVQAKDSCQLSIYPNPVRSPLRLDLDCNNLKDRTFQLTIRDILGKIWFDQEISITEEYQLSLEDIPAGIYFGDLSNDEFLSQFNFIRVY